MYDKRIYHTQPESIRSSYLLRNAKIFVTQSRRQVLPIPLFLTNVLGMRKSQEET